MNRFRIPVPVVLAAFAALAPAAGARKGDPHHESLITARSGLPADVAAGAIAGFAAPLLTVGASVGVSRRPRGSTDAPESVALRAGQESW